jgi:hypothetical protein
MKRELSRFGKKILQPAEKNLHTASEVFEVLRHREVGFEKGLPFFAEHHPMASEVKEEGAHRFQSHWVNLNGKLYPAGVQKSLTFLDSGPFGELRVPSTSRDFRRNDGEGHFLTFHERIKHRFRKKWSDKAAGCHPSAHHSITPILHYS